MAPEAILRGKAWQSVSWLVLGEAAEEAAARLRASWLRMRLKEDRHLGLLYFPGRNAHDQVDHRVGARFDPQVVEAKERQRCDQADSLVAVPISTSLFVRVLSRESRCARGSRRGTPRAGSRRWFAAPPRSAGSRAAAARRDRLASDAGRRRRSARRCTGRRCRHARARRDRRRRRRSAPSYPAGNCVRRRRPAQPARLEVVLDSDWGVHVVVGLPGIFFHEGVFYRHLDGRWQVSAKADGGWRVAASGTIPHAISKAKEHPGPARANRHK